MPIFLQNEFFSGAAENFFSPAENVHPGELLKDFICDLRGFTYIFSGFFFFCEVRCCVFPTPLSRAPFFMCILCTVSELCTTFAVGMLLWYLAS